MTGVSPAGAVFPYDFRFIPKAPGGDGDPLNVLVLMDKPVFTGCLVHTRLIGVMEAKQSEKGKTMRNDRLIGVVIESRTDSDFKSLHDLSAKLVDEIEHVFVSYNEAKGEKFKPIGRSGPDRTKALVLNNGESRIGARAEKAKKLR